LIETENDVSIAPAIPNTPNREYKKTGIIGFI
jgi:hypothetical protein